MYVLRYILLAIVAVIVGSAFSIVAYPAVDFIQHVPTLLLYSSLAVVFLTVVAFWSQGKIEERGKEILMTLFLIAILVPSAYTAGAYLHQKSTSWSGGEVHWHADFEVVVQTDGEYRQLDLIDPEEFCRETRHEASYMCRLNDRTGATEYHEHDDRRIHLEGTFRNREDATLSAFFETFGGRLTNTELVFPTNERTYRVRENDSKTLKIIVQKGVGGDRHWCVIGDDAPRDEVCISSDTDRPARSPQDYVISPFQRGAVLDTIWIIYDDRPTGEALNDLRQDGNYRGMEVTKGGEG